MKLNLPTTLTNPKLNGLLLLTLLRLPASKAGNGFRNCLTDNTPNGARIYDNIGRYAVGKNLSGWNWICCDANGCLPNFSGCDASKIDFACTIFLNNFRNNQGVSCFPELHSSLKCAGIIGNSAVVNDNSVNCASNPPIFLNYLSTLNPAGTDKGYALYSLNCPNPADCGRSQYCTWDNNGLVCYGEFDSTHFCLNQIAFPWPVPVDKNPNTYVYTPISTSTTNPQTTTLSNSNPTTTSNRIIETNNDLAEKIAISVGSAAGTGLIGGLTYYYCRKKKKKKQLVIKPNEQITDDNLKDEVIELVEQELLTSEEIIDTNKVEIQEISEETNQLVTLTPPGSPLPHRSPQQLTNLDPKELLLAQLRNKLVGFEQLWSDYLEANQLLTNNPNSKIIIDSFNNYQNQLLQILTVGEIGLLLENQIINQVRSPQTEYTEFIEEARSPQVIRYGSPQHWG